MKRLTQIQVLGDSVLKGVQVDPATNRYITKNEIDIPALEREFGLVVRNQSHFGATCVKGARLLDRLLSRAEPCDAVVMDFGGNDCDYTWPEIAADPAGTHQPHVPPTEFKERYRTMIRKVQERDMVPVLVTLPPLEPQRFFDWWCRDLDQMAVRRWLGGISNIYAHQEHYSRIVEQVAREEGAALVDVRGTFLNHGHLETLICADGTHPNSAGQELITQAFREFGLRWEKALRQQTA